MNDDQSFASEFKSGMKSGLKAWFKWTLAGFIIGGIAGAAAGGYYFGVTGALLCGGVGAIIGAVALWFMYSEV